MQPHESNAVFNRIPRRGTFVLEPTGRSSRRLLFPRTPEDTPYRVTQQKNGSIRLYTRRGVRILPEREMQGAAS